MTADREAQTADIESPMLSEPGELVYEPPSFDDPQWPPEPAATYARLYKKLVCRCGHEEAWGRVWRLLLYFGGPIFLLVVLAAPSQQDRWYALWNGLVGFLLAALVLFIIFIAWIMNREAAAAAAELSARLIAATRSPRTGRQGLNALDLRRLSQAAAHVQQAADWRGSVVTTVIFALVLTAFTAVAREVTPDYVAAIVAIDDMYASPWPGFLSRVTALAILAYVGFSLFGYFRRFTSQEHANRVILLAAADALAALEDCGLDTASSLGFREKRIVIKRLGYQLSPKPLSFSWVGDFSWPADPSRNPANTWYLEPQHPKQEPYLLDIPLVLLGVLPGMYISLDDLIYGEFLRARGRLRQRTSGVMGAEVKWPLRRKRDDRNQ